MNISQYIDHTLLRQDSSKEEIKKLCEEAHDYNFSAVCVVPYHVKNAAEFLQNSAVQVATVIGFPMGYSATPAKVEEIKRAIDDGADELDVVVNICAVKDKAWSYFRNDLDSMIRASQLKGKIIKIILETDLLTKEEIKKACEYCAELGPDYVKNSTGTLGKATEVETIKFLRQNLPAEIKIKAAGGIRTHEQALQLIEAGAKRIGSSAGINIYKK